MSFTADTIVTMGDGSEQAISDTTAGMSVFDYMLDVQQVTDSTSLAVTDSTVAVLNWFTSSQVKASADQKFWGYHDGEADADAAWIDATAFIPGDRIAVPTSGPEKPWIFALVDSTASESFTGDLCGLQDSTTNSYIAGGVCAQGF